jgi:uncharacterized protein YpmS
MACHNRSKFGLTILIILAVTLLVVVAYVVFSVLYSRSLVSYDVIRGVSYIVYIYLGCLSITGLCFVLYIVLFKSDEHQDLVDAEEKGETKFKATNNDILVNPQNADSNIV